MSLLNKILTGILIVSLITLCIFFGYKSYENGKKLNEIQTSIIEQKQLVDNITRASSEFLTQEQFNAQLKQQGLDLKAIQKDIASFNATLTGMSNLVIVSNPQNVTNVPSTSTTATDNKDTPIDPTTPDPFGYLKNTQKLSLSENFGDVKVPIGEVGFSASKPAPWTYISQARQYDTVSVFGYTASGQPIRYSKVSVTTGGKTYDLPITSNSVQQVIPSAKFSWFNPHLQLGIGGGLQLNGSAIKGEAIPSFSATIASYGKTLTQPDLQFLGVGVGYGTVAKKVDFVFSPIQINVSKAIPFVNNLYVGPYINVNTSGNFGLGLGIGVNL